MFTEDPTEEVAMKAIVVEQQVPISSLFTGMRSRNFSIRRIVFPDEGNLAVALHEGDVFTCRDFDLSRSDITVVGKADVPDEMVEKVLAFQKAKEDLCNISVAIKMVTELNV